MRSKRHKNKLITSKAITRQEAENDPGSRFECRKAFRAARAQSCVSFASNVGEAVVAVSGSDANATLGALLVLGVLNNENYQEISLYNSHPPL